MSIRAIAPSEKRSAHLAAGAHGPVSIEARWVTGAHAEYFYHLAPVPTLEVHYRGHREDLIALGCITAERLIGASFVHFHDDGQGGVWGVESKACAGKRGWLRVTYLTGRRPVAASLPGVLSLFPTEMAVMTLRPALRLVVDNTRRP